MGSRANFYGLSYSVAFVWSIFRIFQRFKSLLSSPSSFLLSCQCDWILFPLQFMPRLSQLAFLFLRADIVMQFLMHFFSSGF